MIDKDNILEIDNSSKPNNQNRKPSKKRKKKDSEAKKFLCIILALVVVFISVVCVFINSRNKKLIAEAVESSKNAEAEIKKNETSIPHGTNPGDAITAPPTQGASTTEQAEKPVVSANVQAAGSIDNPTIITIDEKNWNLTIVNRGYRIPGDYNPDLVYVCGSSERLERRVAENYEKMYNAAAEDGVTLTPCSGYRSYETQERNYNRKIDFFKGQGYSEAEARVKAASIIMPPGSSEHNLGFAMDIVCVDEWFEDTEEFKWLQENAADYGFIMRYPKEKQDVTKVIYEPWHWRYVGVETAKAIKQSGLVMEEYFGVTA